MIYAILVVYNKSLLDSPSYQALKDRSWPLLIVDNSDRWTENKKIADAGGHTYLDMEGNQGLSKAYNAALDFLKNLAGAGDYIALFDDDTHLPDSYFTAVGQQIVRGMDLLYPRVYSSNRQISPARIYRGIVKPTQDKTLPFDELTAINSGLVLRFSLFQNFRYDTGLFLDYVDHAFFLYCHTLDIRSFCLPVVLEQSFSAVVSSKSQAKKRFLSFRKDSRYFYESIVKNKKAYWKVITKRKLRLCLQYKDLQVLFW